MVCLVRLVIFMAVQKLVCQLFEALEAQVGATHHQQWRDGPGREGADRQRGRHQDHLVAQRAQGHGPHHGQFAVGRDARDLLGVERQVVAQHTGRLLGGDLGHHGHIVQHGGDVIDQGKQTAGGHGGSFKFVRVGGWRGVSRRSA